MSIADCDRIKLSNRPEHPVPAVREKIAAAIRDSLLAIRDGDADQRTAAYCDLLVSEQVVAALLPRPAARKVAEILQLTRRIAPVLSKSYQDQLIRFSPRRISITVHRIHTRSKYDKSFREVRRRFPRLPDLYWARVKTPVSDQDAKTYFIHHGAVFFWPGLAELPATLKQMSREQAEARKELQGAAAEAFRKAASSLRAHDCQGDSPASNDSRPDQSTGRNPPRRRSVPRKS